MKEAVIPRPDRDPKALTPAQRALFDLIDTTAQNEPDPRSPEVLRKGRVPFHNLLERGVQIELVAPPSVVIPVAFARLTVDASVEDFDGYLCFNLCVNGSTSEGPLRLLEYDFDTGQRILSRTTLEREDRIAFGDAIWDGEIEAVVNFLDENRDE